MLGYEDMSVEKLQNEKTKLMEKYNEIKLLKLNLDMSRGKPSKKQLDLSLNMLNEFKIEDIDLIENGKDFRNYQNLDETTKAKELFSSLLDVPTDMIIVGNNSSLNLMYTYIANAMLFGILGETPWKNLKKIKFLCPSPGYDRHFAICELLEIEMITIEMDENGPDMNSIKKLVENDESIKGIWCVPKYSNPTGITYKNEIVEQFARLKPKAKDFRIFWDNAYFMHNLNEKEDVLLNIFDECRKYGSENMVLEFASTSKITFPGSGISVIVASKENIREIKNILSKQIICFNILNQVMHYKFLLDKNNVLKLMKEHAKIIKPKFDLVLKTFEKEIKPLNIANWSTPNGGYFISFNSLKGCANRIFELCKHVGIILTPPGSTYPYKKDPQDKNIRIAPTYPELEELKTALDVFCLCVKIASIEKIVEMKKSKQN